MKMSSRFAVATALTALALTSGCGGDDGDDDSGKDAADSAFAKQSGDEIADAAKADMKALDQVKYSGTIPSGDGDELKLDIQASSAGDCTGSISLKGGNAELLSKDGTSWFRPDEALWRAQAPDQADQIIAAVGDKWVVDTDQNFSEFCDLGAFFDSIFSDDGKKAEYKTTGTDEIDGEDVVKVERSTDDGSATGYVVVEGKHYLLKLEKGEGDDAGSLEFSNFDEEFEVEAPAADEIVDLSQLG